MVLAFCRNAFTQFMCRAGLTATGNIIKLTFNGKEGYIGNVMGLH